METKIIAAFEIPNELSLFEKPLSQGIGFDEIDPELNQKSFIISTTRERSTILLLEVSEKPVQQNMMDIFSLNKAEPGDIQDMCCLAYLGQYSFRYRNEIKDVLSSAAFALGSRHMSVGLQKVPLIVNHNSINCGFMASLKNLENYWNPEWLVIAHI